MRRSSKVGGAGVVVAAVILVGATQAWAHTGSGSFSGYEIPPGTVNFTNEQNLCAEFVASANDPLVHELTMSGTFHGQSGSGSATFTRTSAYYLNPEGTYADEDCTTESTVSGSTTIDFEEWDCSGSGTYERRNEEEYTLSFSGTCDDTTTMAVETTSTSATLTATQTVCSGSCGTGYPSGASSTIDGGAYSQTG